MCRSYFPHRRYARYGSKVVWGSLFEGIFLNQCDLSFGHPFGHVCLSASIHFDDQSVMDGGKFLNQNPCMPSWPGVFQFGIFSVILSESKCIFAFSLSSSPSASFPLLLIHSAFFVVVFFWFLYITSKLFSFPCICLLVCLRAIYPYLLVEFFSLFWNILFCLYFFILSRYLFNLPSLACTFCFFSSSCIVISICVAFFLFVSTYSRVYYYYYYYYYYCRCGLQVRPVEEQLKQRVIGERYCISRKRKSYKGSTSRSRLVKCLVRNKKLSSPSDLSSANMFRLVESIFGVW